MTAAEIVADARAGRTDEQALLFLAEMVVALRAAASPGFIRAKQGEPAYLRLDDHDPA